MGPKPQKQTPPPERKVPVIRSDISPNEAARMRLHFNEKAARPHLSHALNDLSKPIADLKKDLSSFKPDCSCVPRGRSVSELTRNPLGDYRHPFGSFYGPSSERLVSWFAGAAGASHEAIGHYSGSVVQKRMMDQPRLKRTSQPASARSDVLRVSSHCA